MKFHSPMIIVEDIEKSKQFYVDVLNEEISQDLESYVVFDGGFSMMSRKQWISLTGDTPASSENRSRHAFELYFEEDRLEDFMQKIKNANITMFTELAEAPWGQRACRFLDPDKYVIEVAESMKAVVKRLLLSGLTVQEAAERSLMPINFVEECAAEPSNAD
jgi:catechol 2,3-dioxygenase-like lactoylglutathione lyase family enzyme